MVTGGALAVANYRVCLSERMQWSHLDCATRTGNGSVESARFDQGRIREAVADAADGLDVVPSSADFLT